MRPNTTISISEARKKIFEIAKEVQKPGNYYTFTEKGKPTVVMMSFDEFESWAETLEVMQEFPDLDKDIQEAREDYKKGNYITLESLLAKEGFVLADKPNKQDEARRRDPKKGSKGNR